MKLIIDIPEETYKATCNGSMLPPDVDNVVSAIKNCIPLPKEHGRLIDADVLCDFFWDNRSKLFTYKDLQIVIDRQPTIIEADKGE